MSTEAVLALLLLGFAAGTLGAIAGIGGGILITPVLVIFFNIPIPQAVGISLLAVIATSTAASSVHVERHVTDVRLGMTLELGTTVGAAIAALAATHISRRVVAALFVVFLGYSAVMMLRRALASRADAAEPEITGYTVRRYPLGMAAALVAGGASGLLGIGSGPIKVPVMYLFMGVPLRVAAATSNFMIGVTAATSAYIYYGRGDIRLEYAAPLVAGVFAGSLVGARLAPRVRVMYVQYLLILVMLYLAVQMLVRLAEGKIG